MKGTELTSSQPGEFAGIRPGDKITVVIDDVAVRRTVKFNSYHAAGPEPEPEPEPQHSKPKLSRRILQSIFDKLDADGRGVVSQRELRRHAAAQTGRRDTSLPEARRHRWTFLAPRRPCRSAGCGAGRAAAPCLGNAAADAAAGGVG